MDSRIELQLDRTIIVLGPAVTAALADSDDQRVPTSFESMKTGGLAQISEHLDIVTQKEAVQARLHDMFVAATGSKVAGCSGNRSSALTKHLLNLQREGALLAYLYPDTIIDQALELKSVSAAQMDEWVEHSKCIMHLYGIYSDFDSMKCLIMDDMTLQESVLHVFKNKICVCVGFDVDQEGKSDVQTFLTKLPVQEMSRVLLTCEQNLVESTQALPVATSNFFQALCPIGDTSKAIGSMIDHTTNQLGKPISLLMANKTDYVKVAKVLLPLPGMNFQMLSSMDYSGLSFHVLTAQVDSDRFHQFWHSLMQPSTIQSLVNYTVLAIVLGKGTFIWLGGGKSPKITNPSSTLGELLSNSWHSNASSSQPLPLSNNPNLTPTVKPNKTHPRYTIKKQKVDSNKFDQATVAPSSALLKRRMSLPHHSTFMTSSSSAAAAATALNAPSHINSKVKSTDLQPNSCRQQVLLSQHLLNCKSEAAAVPRRVKNECKLLRQLLQEKPKEFPRPSVKAVKFLSDWITSKQQSLFVSDSREWSSNINDALEKRLSKWRRMKERRLRKMAEEEEQKEKLRRSSFDSNSSSNLSDVIKQHSSSTAMHGLINGQIQTPLLTPYILPQATNFALRAASMMYQPSYHLPSYPLLTPLPVPYLLPNAPNLVLVSSSSLGSSSTSTVSGATSAVRNFATGVPQPISIPAPSFSSSSIETSPVLLQPKRKYSDPSKSYSVISSLLTRKDTDLTPSKKSRMVYSPASLSDEKSDEESNSENMSCDSSETEENQLQLWKFLLELLLSNSHSHLIEWSSIHSLEFHVKEPKEIAKLWSRFKRESSFDYNRFKKSIHYYCTKDNPVLNSVSGKENVYCFSSSMLYYINNRYPQLQKAEVSVLGSKIETSQELCGSQEVLVVD